MQAPAKEGGFVHFAQKIEGFKQRARSVKFLDHYSQAAMFFASQSPPEQMHIVNALRFELGKVETPAIRERMLFQLSQVNRDLAEQVAVGLGAKVPAKNDGLTNRLMPADANPKDYQPQPFTGKPRISPPLSMAVTTKDTVQTRKVAALVADGFDDAVVAAVKKQLTADGAMLKLVAPHGGTVTAAGGKSYPVDFSLLTVASVLFDAVFLPGGEESVAALLKAPRAIEFVDEACKHCKAIAATGEGLQLLQEAKHAAPLVVDADGEAREPTNEQGVIVGGASAAKKIATEFTAAIAKHRAWEREKPEV